MQQLREELDIPEDQVTARLDSGTPAGRLCLDTGHRLQLSKTDREPLGLDIARAHGRSYSGMMSTQQSFGLVLTEISRGDPELYKRVVTVSPDVASSTNLGGWINKVGVWARGEKEHMPESEGVRALQWAESARGQHIELGITENNLFLCLGQLGLSFEMTGELLFPIGTLYDPFIRRGLDALMYSAYSGAKFIAIGTPSGLTLGPEGGSHQSLVTPSVGIGLPELAYYEPCFGQELEWILLSALDKIRLRRESTYLRLTTKRVDQALFNPPSDPEALERLRLQVVAGAYRQIDRSSEPGYRPGSNVVHIVACGAMVPGAIEASRLLLEEGVFANVINATGPGPLYSSFHDSVRSTMKGGSSAFLTDVVPLSERGVPLVTVADGHPLTLAWLGSALGSRAYPLGVTRYGQSGSPPELYQEYEIDVPSIMAACFGALES